MNNKSKLGIPPKINDPKPLNLSKNSNSKLVPLNFFVSSDFKRNFKVYASERDMKMVDLLKSAFEEFKKNNV